MIKKFQKFPLVLCLSLLVVPGCWKKKKGVFEGAATQEGVTQEERVSIFDEQESAFVLEDNKNPFTPEGSVRLVEGDSLWEKEQQFEPIYFDFDQYHIRPDQKNSLNRTMHEIQGALADDDLLVIEGHACNSAGSAAYNVMLSEKRAQEVKSYFVGHGFTPDRIKTVGRGFEMRKVASGTREQQAPNRRVEFYIARLSTRQKSIRV